MLHQPEGSDMSVATVETVAETIMWLLKLALKDLNAPDAPTNAPAKKSKILNCY